MVLRRRPLSAFDGEEDRRSQPGPAAPVAFAPVAAVKAPAGVVKFWVAKVPELQLLPRLPLAVLGS